jgi:choline dehydrogenase-like flavoprotein
MPGDSTSINNKSKSQNTYDAIVVGSGISGGWAAKELCEKGLKVLLLERGEYCSSNYPLPQKNFGIFAPLTFNTRRQEKTLFKAGIILFAKTINIFISTTRRTSMTKQNALIG